MFNSDKALESLKMVESLRDDLSRGNILNYSGHLSHRAEGVIESGITKKDVLIINKLYNNLDIGEINNAIRKLNALLELLGVTEISGKVEPKLVKGKKEVSLAVKK